MIRFAHPEYLYLLAAVPLLIALSLWSAHARRRAWKRLGNPVLLQQLVPDAGSAKRAVRFLLVVLAFSLAIAGLANPQVGTRMETVKREGVDILIALDVSNSMKAEDFQPDRLENAKQQISLMLDKLQNDRIGIVVFAGSSYLQLPLTTDYSAARLLLSAIDTEIVPVQGTAIGSAIRLAMKSFVKGETKHKVVIVISDGENHEDDAEAAARDAAKEGIVVHAIGMGSPQGVPIPLYRNGIASGYRKDADGSVVVTRLNEAALQRIADAGKGRYIRATNRQDELDAIFKEIAGMEKKEFGARVFTEYEDRFQYPLAAALLFLIAEFFLTERKSRWGARLKSSFLFRAAVVICGVILAGPASADSDRSLVRSGNRQYDAKQFSDAEVSYKKALEKNKDLSQGIFNLGDALYKQERYQEAANQFRAAAAHAPDAPSRAQAYHNLGNALLKDKKLEEAVEAYKNSLKVNPGDPDTKYNLEYARRMLEQQKQQQQQNQQNQDKQDKKQDKDKQNPQDQKKEDQKKEDQKQQQDQQGKGEDQKKKEQQDQQQKPQQDTQQQSEQQKQQISQKDAERILDALKNEEKNVQKKLLKKVPGKDQLEKDWR